MSPKSENSEPAVILVKVDSMDALSILSHQYDSVDDTFIKGRLSRGEEIRVCEVSLIKCEKFPMTRTRVLQNLGRVAFYFKTSSRIQMTRRGKEGIISRLI
ncbi:hypothetical protein CDAR_260181 [Caerostris darwini]|uniref:Uncharacterized protein n=1 Tax=Caerostris darwini TaxID=1538125 RepID=A0AAV4SUW7_9ARAC|nr:hypothetical protein CDAR_260181 [Caerostris darwini]